MLDVDDAFPLDPGESLDTDRDGTGNNADLDDDGDGRTDNSDTYPLDTDNDGIDNNIDDDDDNDSVLDVDDEFPLDEEEWEDINQDGLGDNFPIIDMLSFKPTTEPSNWNSLRTWSL